MADEGMDIKTALFLRKEAYAYYECWVVLIIRNRYWTPRDEMGRGRFSASNPNLRGIVPNMDFLARDPIQGFVFEHRRVSRPYHIW